MNSNNQSTQPTKKTSHFNVGDPVHENTSHYVAQVEDPYIYNGEPMNWAVINKEYGTVEATLSALANAMITCEQLHETIVHLRRRGMEVV